MREQGGPGAGWLSVSGPSLSVNASQKWPSLRTTPREYPRQIKEEVVMASRMRASVLTV